MQSSRELAQGPYIATPSMGSSILQVTMQRPKHTALVPHVVNIDYINKKIISNFNDSRFNANKKDQDLIESVQYIHTTLNYKTVLETAQDKSCASIL